MKSKNVCNKNRIKSDRGGRINLDVKSVHPLYLGIKNWAIKNIWKALIIEPEKESPVNKIVKPIL